MKYDKSINRKCNRYDKLEVVSKDLIKESDRKRAREQEKESKRKRAREREQEKESKRKRAREREQEKESKRKRAREQERDKESKRKRKTLSPSCAILSSHFLSNAPFPRNPVPRFQKDVLP